MVALDRMRARGQGTIVQVGSALGSRSIPLLARTGYRSQQTQQPADPGQPANLLQPVDGVHGQDFGAHGIFDDRSHDRSSQLWLSQHSRVSTGRFPSRRVRRVAQLLGTRHLAQAAVTAAIPVPEVLELGAAVDATHAASMVMLSPASGTAWPAALLDALAEAAFAAAGFSCGRAAGT